MDITEHEKKEAPLAPTSEQEDRRRWSRVSDDKHSRMWFSTPNEGAQQGEVVEMSLGGFAMIVKTRLTPPVGQQIVVGFEEWLIPARVKYVSDTGRGSYRVGMEWVRPESSAVKTLLQRCAD